MPLNKLVTPAQVLVITLSLLAALAVDPPVALAQASSPTAPGEHRVLLHGVHLWYKIAGAPHPGTAPLIYLPGGPGYNSYSFEKTIGPQLERHVQMIYFDERGTGRSERPASKDYAMPTLVADIEALRQSLGLPQLSVMGQSFGGTLALEYARAYPEHVQKLILVDGASDFPDAFVHWETELKLREPAKWATAMHSDLGAALSTAEKGVDPCILAKARFAVILSVYINLGESDFHQWQQFHTRRFDREQQALDTESGLQNTGEMQSVLLSPGGDLLCYRFTAYNRLTMPVLIMQGRYDGAVNPEQSRALAAHVPGAIYDEFAQSAHFPYAEEPAKFEADVAGFLAPH